MKLLFLFDGDLEAEQYTVEIVSSEGLELSIHFKECEIDCFYIGGYEFTMKDANIINGVFLNFGKGLDLNILPLASVLQQATSQNHKNRCALALCYQKGVLASYSAPGCPMMNLF